MLESPVEGFFGISVEEAAGKLSFSEMMTHTVAA
jgi:hypothetical protein